MTALTRGNDYTKYIISTRMNTSLIQDKSSYFYNYELFHTWESKQVV